MTAPSENKVNRAKSGQGPIREGYRSTCRGFSPTFCWSGEKIATLAIYFIGLSIPFSSENRPKTEHLSVL